LALKFQHFLNAGIKPSGSHLSESVMPSSSIELLPLTSQVALVTGAGSGIGRAAAVAFSRSGATVVLAGRREAELQATAAAIKAEGGRADVAPTDVADPTAAQALVRGIVRRHGRLDAAFNNAGISAYAPIEALTLEDFDRVMSVNVRAVWWLVREQIAVMREQGTGGAIVNTSSIAATGGTAGLSVYAASKGALDAMVRAVALEVGGQDIRINNVSPDVIQTPMSAGLPAAAAEMFARHAALGRLGQPADIGDVAVWLCTDAARFITGQNLVVDGGFNIAGAR
jgi:NAD(P)-dependent dehydrogenase (short-subunit alcohol dehydrogenase family)